MHQVKRVEKAPSYPTFSIVGQGSIFHTMIGDKWMPYIKVEGVAIQNAKNFNAVRLTDGSAHYVHESAPCIIAKEIVIKD